VQIYLSENVGSEVQAWKYYNFLSL